MSIWSRLTGKRPQPVVHHGPPPNFWELSPEIQERIWWREDPQTQERYLELHPEIRVQMEEAQLRIAEERKLQQRDPTGYYRSIAPGEDGWWKAKFVLNGTAQPFADAPETPVGYQEFLKTPYWRSIRRQVLHRDGHTCRRCGTRPQSSFQLIVHHLTYQHHGPYQHQYLGDLVTLCRGCHNSVH